MESNYYLKVGDFDQARGISDGDGSVGRDEVTIVGCEEDGSARIDLEAAAFLLFRIFTLNEGEYRPLTDANLDAIPEVELRILILSLLKGLPAS